MLAVDLLAKLFGVDILSTIKADSLKESEDTAAALALAAATPILAEYDDEPVEIHEAVDGFIVSGASRALFIGNAGDMRLATPKPDEATDDAMIDAVKGKACAADAFAEITKGLVPEIGQAGKKNFLDYKKDGKSVAYAVKGDDGKDKYLIPLPENEIEENALIGAIRVHMDRANKAMKAGKHDEAKDHLAKAQKAVAAGSAPYRKKVTFKEGVEGSDISAVLNEAADLMESEDGRAAAMEKLHEAYMKVTSDGSYNADAPYSVYGASLSFRPDYFIDSTPDYSVASFVMTRAVQDVMKGDIGKQLVAAVRKSLADSDKVKALEIVLREKPLGESLNEDNQNTYDEPALRARIATLHDFCNETLPDGEKLGAEDDATLYLGGSQRRDYQDARAKLGQRLQPNEDRTRGTWVSAPGHFAGGGKATEGDKIGESAEALAQVDEVDIAIPHHHVGLFAHAKEHGAMAMPQEAGKGKAAYLVAKKDATPEWRKNYEASLHKEHPGVFTTEHHDYGVMVKGKTSKAKPKAATESRVMEKGDFVSGGGKTYVVQTDALDNATMAPVKLNKDTDQFEIVGPAVKAVPKEINFLGKGVKEAAESFEKGNVSPYAGKDDDGDEDEDGDGNDPDETVAAIVTGGKGLELRAGYDGDGDVLASEECDPKDDDDCKEALQKLADVAKDLGYTYVPHTDEHYDALSRILVRYVTAEHTEQVAAFDKAVAEDDAAGALKAATEIVEKAGKKLPAGIVEGLSSRKHKPGRKPSLKARFRHGIPAKPKGKTGPGADGKMATHPAGKKGINIGEGVDAKNIRQTGPGAKGEFSTPAAGKKGLDIAKGKKVGEADTNQEPVDRTPTGVRKAKTPGPQNLIPPGNTPPKTEGTSVDSMSKQCACPNCEATQGIKIEGKGKMSCDNCGYTGGPADFQISSTATDTVEAAEDGTVDVLVDLAKSGETVEGLKTIVKAHGGDLVVEAPMKIRTSFPSAGKASKFMRDHRRKVSDKGAVAKTTEAWVDDVRKMSVEEFVAHTVALTSESNEDFKVKVDALVEAYKTGPHKKDIARKLTAFNHVVRKKLGKGIAMESIHAELNSKFAITFPKGKLDEFLAAAQAAAIGEDGEVEALDETMRIVLSHASATKLKEKFSGDGIEYAPAE